MKHHRRLVDSTVALLVFAILPAIPASAQSVRSEQDRKASLAALTRNSFEPRR